MSISSGLKSVLDWLVRRFAFLTDVWGALRNLGLTLRPCRFSLMMVLAGIAFLFLSDQGLDTLRDFAERKTGSQHDVTQTLFFFLGAFLWAYGSWYWARVLLAIRFDPAPEDKPWVRGLQNWLPRLIGLAAILALALAFWRAAVPYPADADSPGLILKRYAWYSLAGAAAFLAFALTRHDFGRWLATKLGDDQPSLLNRYLRSGTPAAVRVYGQAEVAEALRYSWPMLLVTLLVALALFVAFAISPETFGPHVGSTPILLLAAAGWIAFGSAADLFGMRARFPVFITLFLLAVAFSFFNDNHAVRTMYDPAVVRAANRAPLQAALKEWELRQTLRPVARARQHYPLFIVAAEGGGIRAAYWTATVLATLQDRNPCFADQLFALSGVSGGSLGSTVFEALLADQRYALPNFRCDAGSGAPLAPDAQAILSEDFLAPAMAAMLYPDLLQRVLPVPVAHFDRARALEVAWERAWREHRQSDRFAQPFDRLWQDAHDYWMPALFLNSTWVETGKRLIASNLRLTPEDFNDVEDLHLFYDNRALPLSTTVHLSARFTYVSPAGSLTRDGRVYGHAVDGGYFENSGTTTVIEILKTIDQLAQDNTPSSGFWKRVDPYVILISNEPIDPRFDRIGLGSWPKDRATTPAACCHEVLAPLTTLLNTRAARGIYASEAVKWHVGPDQFFHFGLCQDNHVEIPLGWTLSKVVRDTMQEQLAADRCAPFPNAGNLSHIDRLIQERFARAGRR